MANMFLQFCVGPAVALCLPCSHCITRTVQGLIEQVSGLFGGWWCLGLKRFGLGFVDEWRILIFFGQFHEPKDAIWSKWYYTVFGFYCILVVPNYILYIYIFIYYISRIEGICETFMVVICRSNPIVKLQKVFRYIQLNLGGMSNKVSPTPAAENVVPAWSCQETSRVRET